MSNLPHIADFYKTTDDTPEYVSRTVRQLILDDEIQDIHKTQKSQYTIRNEGTYQVCDVEEDGELINTYYLGTGRDKTATQGLLAYVMFNATYGRGSEVVFEYEFRPSDALTIGLVGTLYSERLREVFGPQHRDRYCRRPALLGMRINLKGKEHTKQEAYSSIEHLQDRAQALRCFAYQNPKQFIDFIVQAESDALDIFVNNTWLKNTGANETQLLAREYWVARELIKEEPSAPVEVDGNGSSDRLPERSSPTTD